MGIFKANLFIKVVVAVFITAALTVFPCAATDAQTQNEINLQQQSPSPSVTIKKYFSPDNGVTWLDADTPPGPTIAVGSTVQFRFVITNNGNVALTNLSLADSVYSLGGITLPASLSPGVTFEHTLTTTAVSGQHNNRATVNALYTPPILAAVVPPVYVSASDMAHYFGDTQRLVPRPGLGVKKYVSADNGVTWLDADTPSGPTIAVGSTVKFRFVITNSGNVALTNLSLTDSAYSLGGITPPASLSPGASFEHIFTTDAVSGQHSNRATATGRFEQQLLTSSDMAHYQGIIPSAPAIEVKKYISVDGGSSWFDAPDPRGPEVTVGNEIQFKFIIENTGNETLTDLTLTDNVYNLVPTALPVSLAPGLTFEYVLTDITASAGQHINRATVTGWHNGVEYQDSDIAYYYGVTPVIPRPEDNPTPPTGGHSSLGVLMAAISTLSGLYILVRNKRWKLSVKGNH